jgi:assimilatory nitrate reductase catalytic subunit
VAPAKSGWRIELAGCADPADWDEAARTVFGVAGGETGDMIAFHDQTKGQHRYAAFSGDNLVGALFIAREPVGVARAWAAERLAQLASNARDRFAVLSGRAGAAEKDRGAIVCACFEVGVNEIIEAITRGGCLSVDAVGAALKAGTNCGSCRSEIGRLVHNHCIKEAV